MVRKGRLVSAKRKFRGPGIPMAIGTGFPDYICFKKSQKLAENSIGESIRVSVVQGVECKSLGYLDKEEKEKCRWLLNNHIFSKILIASRGKKRGTIKYKEFKTNGKNRNL